MIGLSIIDGTYYPLPLALEVQNGRAKAPDMSGNHKLLVISEEQFKVNKFMCFHCNLASSCDIDLVHVILVVIRKHYYMEKTASASIFYSVSVDVKLAYGGLF